MWLVTEYGLNRFDGYDFRWFTKAEDGLHADACHNLLLDPNGYIWILYGLYDSYAEEELQLSGIDILEPLTGQIQSVESFFSEVLP
jgi:hypothetical protein